ncbi:unnamed protein product, partial [Musa acuminata subsp. burmannicoides]
LARIKPPFENPSEASFPDQIGFLKVLGGYCEISKGEFSCRCTHEESTTNVEADREPPLSLILPLASLRRGPKQGKQLIYSSDLSTHYPTQSQKPPQSAPPTFPKP